MKPIRVLLADDHPLIVLGISTALNELGIRVVGHVSDANEVIAQYLAKKPDVLVLDIRFGDHMPSGLDVARELLQRDPQTRVVFYSQFDSDEMIKEAYRLGGAAFITKNSEPRVLADAIERAHAGKPYLQPDIAERLALLGVRGDDSPQSRLDQRELEVFRCMAKGMTNAEIAERMELSAKTISTISQTIKEKLGVHRAADITLLAVKHRLVEP